MTFDTQSDHSVLTAWLQHHEPYEADNGALVQTIVENDRPPDLTSSLADEMLDARFPLDLLNDYAKILGLDAASEIVRGLVPTGCKIRKGYFGEVIAACCLRDFDGCWIPVKKLRTMISSNQSLPGIDVIGAHVVDNRIESLVFVEAKVRTGRDRRVILSASEELLHAFQQKFPPMLHFMAVQLQEQNDPMYESFLHYLWRRDHRDTQELPYVYLLCENGTWSDRNLSLLEDLVPLPEGFRVSVIEIASLAQLIESVYSSINISVDDSDDE